MSMSTEIVSIVAGFVALVVTGLVGLGVEGSERTKISGVFAAGWLTLMEGVGFIALWGLDALAHGLVLGVVFVAIGIGIVSLPIAHREFQRASGDH